MKFFRTVLISVCGDGISIGGITKEGGVCVIISVERKYLSNRTTYSRLRARVVCVGAVGREESEVLLCRLENYARCRSWSGIGAARSLGGLCGLGRAQQGVILC